MRIISGIYGGRRLSPPKNISARPTTDFAKESLFNLLNNRMDFENIDVLDLFAGTGGIGLEFVSRGARSVTSVELAHTQQNFIIAACKQLDIHNLTLVRSDVFKFLNTCHVQYDFVYADPPYSLDKLPLLPDLIFGLSDRDKVTENNPHASLLKKGGWFVLEHSKANEFSRHAHFVEERNYGNVHFSFFQ